MEALFELIKTGGSAVGLVVLYFIWKKMEHLEANMVTKDAIQLAITEMEVRLTNWANDRFLPRSESEQITNGHAEQLRDLRDQIQYGRRSTDR